MKSGQVEIHLILPDANGPETFLTADEKERAARFRFEHDQRAWSASRSALRKILADELRVMPANVPIIIDPMGKPMLAAPWQDLHFNLSHCDGMAVVALSRDAPLGIDIEHESRGASLVECETSFCHPAEIASLPAGTLDRRIALLEIWTAKEAVLKAVGTGLTCAPEKLRIDFKSFPIRANGDFYLTRISQQRLYPLAHPRLTGYRGHLSSPASVRAMRYFDGECENLSEV